MPFCQHIYDFTEQKFDDGNEKFVFVAFYPVKRTLLFNLNDKEDLYLRLFINCFIKTSDGFCIEFKIQSYETLAEFNYQEKMDIINSIYENPYDTEWYRYDYSMGTLEIPTPVMYKEDVEDLIEFVD